MANASITFQVGQVTAVTESNAEIAVIAEFMNDFIAALNGPVDGTNQEKADWVVAQFRQRMSNVVTNYRRNVAANTARDAEPVSDL